MNSRLSIFSFVFVRSRLVAIAAHESPDRAERIRLCRPVAMVCLKFSLTVSALLTSARLCVDTLEDSPEPLVIFTTGRTNIKPRALVGPQINFSFR